MTTVTPPPKDDLLAKLQARIDVNDNYAKQLEEAVRTWESLDESPGALASGDTVVASDTPTSIPWPTRQLPPVPAEVPAYAEMLRVLPEPIVLLDAAGIVKFWSRAAEEVFGWMSFEVVGKLPPFLGTAHAPEHADILASTLRDSPIRERIVSRRSKDQRSRAFTLFTTLTADGDVLMRFSDPPKPPVEAPAPKLEKLGRMVASVSHDFNNVVTAIIGSADVLADKTPAGSPNREWIDIIRVAGNHAGGLTKRLLEISKPVRLPAVTIDLSETVEQLLPLVTALLPAGVRLKSQLDPHLPGLTIESTIIEQILLNLTTNAGQAMPRGGVIQIRTSAHTVNDAPHVMLAVADSGAGIDDATRARLFEPYFTTRGGGTGLGLATVRELVTQAGGTVELDTHAGLGSIFRVILPANGDRNEPFGTGRTALIADDDPSSREFIKRALESAGFNINEAKSTDEALSVAKWLRQDIDLVIADIVMPTIGGRSLVDKLTAQNPELAIVLVSGYPQGELNLPSSTRFLSKPFRAKQLLDCVKRVVKCHTGQSSSD